MNKHVLGFSRIGSRRDLKQSLESIFKSNDRIDFYKKYTYLNELKKKILYKNWKSFIYNEIDYINVGDFSLYDHILDTIFFFNLIPKRFDFSNNEIFNYFTLIKGNEKGQAMEMVKWFNTNYHYIVPEFYFDTKPIFNLNFFENDINYCKLLKKNIKFIILGPLTLLKIGKIKDNVLKNRILLLPFFLEEYIKIINYLNNKNINIIQIDEPISILNLSYNWINYLKNTYIILCSYFTNIIFASYFEEINKNILKKIKNIPFLSVHNDLTVQNKNNILSNNFNFFSLGLIDGKNIWSNNLENSWYFLKKFLKTKKKFFLSTSCSLMHVPLDKNVEKINKKSKIIYNWLSFGYQKLNELKILSKLYNNIKKRFFLIKSFIKNIFFIKNKKKSKLVFLKNIFKDLKNLNINDFKYRNKDFYTRNILQKKYFNFKSYISTTIGSFPQTKKIRKIRLDYKKNIINKLEYENFLKREINYVVKKQVDFKLDVLVHGEPERNDMVEYFAESLEGFLLTNSGWVQSYGFRYVKPPIIYGDISLKNYITINWIKYAQNIAKKPVKSILTGPITILKWSFRRNDQPNYLTSIQLALALNKEILKLEKIGIKIIQIDEPAIREFLPIKKDYYNNYFNWSVKSFLLLYKNIKLTTQIHSHICYSDFKNIISFIKDFDLDVISIESSRSNFEIINKMKKINVSTGYGIYDIHTNRILNIDYSIFLIKLIINNIRDSNIWINPDCGLKTRKWYELNKSIINMTYSCDKVFNTLCVI